MLKIEEQRLMTTVDSLKEAIIAIDGNYRVLRINKTASQTKYRSRTTDRQAAMVGSVDLSGYVQSAYIPDIRKHHSDQAKDRSQRGSSRLPKHP